MSSQSIQDVTKRPDKLRRAMRANGIFSGLSGLILILDANALSDFTGLSYPIAFVGLGAVLLLYAAGLLVATSQAWVDRRLGYVAVALDIGWVVGSAILLLAGWPPLTVAGKWLVALLAEVVFLFAAWQTIALRKSKLRS